jgi:hypothetical protein
MEQLALATSDFLKWLVANTLRLLSVYPIGLLMLALLKLMIFDSPWAEDLAKIISQYGLELWLLLPLGMLLAAVVVVLLRCIINVVFNRLDATQVQFWTASSVLIVLVGLQVLYIDALWIHFDVDNAENLGFIQKAQISLIYIVSRLSVIACWGLLVALIIGVMKCGYSGVYPSLKRSHQLDEASLMADPDLDQEPNSR